MEVRSGRGRRRVRRLAGWSYPCGHIRLVVCYCLLLLVLLFICTFAPDSHES